MTDATRLGAAQARDAEPITLGAATDLITDMITDLITDLAAPPVATTY